MRPVLWVFAGVPVQAYGFFLGLAFIVAAASWWWELRRHQAPTWVVLPSLAVAMVAGLLGGRAASLLEGQSGLNYLGGFLLAAPIVVLVLRAAHVELRLAVDSVAPGLCFAYATARVGCQLSGDGDYGVASDLPWAMAYPHGTVPTLERVHPTPVYETIVAVLLAVFLIRLARRAPPRGTVFASYLVLSGLARFGVEFLRRNDVAAVGLTQAQILSLLLVMAGVAWLVRLRRDRR